VLTVAVADAILCGAPYAEKLREWHALYPHAGYGGSFRRWASTPGAGPYNSWGNGSAMRVSPVGYAFDTIGSVLDEAASSAAVTHNHPEGIKGARAVGRGGLHGADRLIEG
jgi:ADP-ribosylglycohydrolase